MVFKLLFLLSLLFVSVFFDAIGLVEYDDEISSLDKFEWGFAKRSFFCFVFLSELFIAVTILNGELCKAMVILDHSTLLL